MTKRRAHGEGTIFQLSSGKWQADISLGYKPDGKRNRKSLYGKTQKEVRQKLDALKQQLSQGTFSSSKLTVADYLEQWIKEKARQVKPRTEELYRHCINAHIVPRIGNKQLSKLTPLDVQRMVGSVADEVGVSSANKSRTVLYSAMRQALRWQLVIHNPVEAVDTLKEKKRDMLLWTPQEAVRFLEAARAHRLYALFYLAMTTGMRRGELLGLMWSDLKGDMLNVRRSLTLVSGKPTVSTPKTYKATRWVALSPDVMDTLEAHRTRQLAESTFLGDVWQKSDLMFTSEVGTPFNPHNVARLRKQLFDKAKVPHVRLHDLRHLHASLAIKGGMDPKMLADRLGHAKASFTMDVYAHLFDEQRANSAVSITGYLDAGRPPSSEAN